jgi:ribonuclease T1
VLFSTQLIWCKSLKKLGLLLSLICCIFLLNTAYARSSSAEIVHLSELPVEAQKTHQLILNGGPFPYEKDGVVFGNRERILPINPRGFYREYTVPTPRASHRGARRIVCGGRLVRNPESCFYTGDHYSTFKKIVQ